MLYFIVVMYCFLLYVYLYNWAAYLGQDTPGKEIFNLSEVLSWLNKGHKFFFFKVCSTSKSGNYALSSIVSVKCENSWMYQFQVILDQMNHVIIQAGPTFKHS